MCESKPLGILYMKRPKSKRRAAPSQAPTSAALHTDRERHAKLRAIAEELDRPIRLVLACAIDMLVESYEETGELVLRLEPGASRRAR